MDTFHAPERQHVPNSGDERLQLNAWLDFYRATLLVKCDGLSVAQLKTRPFASSSLSLLGIVRHMTYVEQLWFETVFTGADTAAYYVTAGDNDADFNDLESDAAETVFDLYQHVVSASSALAAGHSPDEIAKKPRRGREVDLRWIYLHMIEEYARHCGHADLIREMIDGTTGY
ncbi:MAG TPA: DinB family protein [Acidimicrobiales bacterium]